MAEHVQLDVAAQECSRLLRRAEAAELAGRDAARLYERAFELAVRALSADATDLPWTSCLDSYEDER
jgi:hypothetical protein